MIIFFLLLGIIIALLSFVPRLKHPYIFFKKPNKNDNLLYFGDIAKYTDKEYIAELKKQNIKNNNQGFELYLVNQIIVNSIIAVIVNTHTLSHPYA